MLIRYLDSRILLISRHLRLIDCFELLVNTTRYELEKTTSDRKRTTRNNILKLSLCALTSIRPVRVNKADKYIINKLYLWE